MTEKGQMNLEICLSRFSNLNKKNDFQENEQNLGINDKRSNIYTIRVPGGECGAAKIFEDVVTENFPSFTKDINIDIKKFS